jgi:hypothetical protein
VDDIAWSSTHSKETAFGVDEALGNAFPYPVPFLAWVTSAKRYWVNLAKRRSLGVWWLG